MKRKKLTKDLLEVGLGECKVYQMEMWKCYKNEKGEMLHILIFLKTKAFGATYIAEYINTQDVVEIISVNMKDLESENWTEVDEKEFESKINSEGSECTNYI